MATREERHGHGSAALGEGLGCLFAGLRGEDGTVSGGEVTQDAALLGAEAIAVTPDEAHLYVAAHYAGAVTRYRVDRGQPLDPAPFAHPSLAGAEAVALSPDLLTEHATSPHTSVLAVLDRDPIAGTLALRQAVSGDELDEAAGIAPSPDGAWVYVAARGADAITALAVGEDGHLLHLESVGAAGIVDWPSGIALAPDGRFALVASALSCSVTVWRVAREGQDGCGGVCP